MQLLISYFKQRSYECSRSSSNQSHNIMNDSGYKRCPCLMHNRLYYRELRGPLTETEVNEINLIIIWLILLLLINFFNFSFKEIRWFLVMIYGMIIMS